MEKLPLFGVDLLLFTTWNNGNAKAVIMFPLQCEDQSGTRVHLCSKCDIPGTDSIAGQACISALDLNVEELRTNSYS